MKLLYNYYDYLYSLVSILNTPNASSITAKKPIATFILLVLQMVLHYYKDYRIHDTHKYLFSFLLQ